MGKNLLLANLVDNYSFENTRDFMISEINDLFNAYHANNGVIINEVLFLPGAYEGDNINDYLANVRVLFGDRNVKLITDGHDPVQMINGAEAIIVGGGNITRLENTYGYNIRTAIKNRVNTSGIPYLAWNEGSEFACPKKIDDLGTLSTDLLGIVPFQLVSHFIDNHQNRNSISDFLLHNPNIKYVVCFSNEVPLARDLKYSIDIVGASNTSGDKTASDKGGSGIQIEEENSKLVAEGNTKVTLFNLDENGNLYSVPDPDFSVLMR